MSSKELYDIIRYTSDYKIYHLFNARTLENTLQNSYYYIISDVYSGMFEIYKLPFEKVCKLSIHDNSNVIIDRYNFKNVEIVDTNIYPYSLYKTSTISKLLDDKINELTFRLI